MRMKSALRVALGLVATVAFFLAASRSASAQGVLVQGLVAASEAGKSTSPTISGSVGYQFNRVLGLGVELSYLRKFDNTAAYPYYCCGNAEGHAVVFTTNVRLEIPTTSSRFIPYVVGGGGMAAVTQNYDVIYAAAATAANLAQLTGANVVAPIYGGPSLTTTTTSMALTLGGGASILVTSHVAIDVDLRALRLMGSNTMTLGRFGGGVSYRF